MLRLVRPVFLSILLAAPGSVFAQDVVGTVSRTTSAGFIHWSYTFSFTGLTAQGTVKLRMALPDLVVAPAFTGPQPTNTTRVGAYTEWVFNNGGDTELSIVMAIAGRDTRVTDGTVPWLAEHVAGPIKDEEEIAGPSPTFDVSWIRPIFGAGLNIRNRSDASDFSTDGGRLLITNPSRHRPSFVVGGAFRLWHLAPRREHKYPVSAILSLEFTDGSREALDGILMGMSVSVSKFLDLAAGLSVNRGTGLSPGFGLAAVATAQGVTNDQTLSEVQKEPFRRLLAGNDEDRLEESLDGIPLTDPRTGQEYFPGNPIIENFRRTWFVGFVVPLELGALFRQ